LGKNLPLLAGRESSPLRRGHHLRVRCAPCCGGRPFARPSGSLRGGPRSRTHLYVDQGRTNPIVGHVCTCRYFKWPQAGVSAQIGTGGCVDESLTPPPLSYWIIHCYRFAFIVRSPV